MKIMTTSFKQIVLLGWLLHSSLVLAGGPYFDKGRYEGRGWCKDAAGQEQIYDVVFTATKGSVTVLTTDEKKVITESSWAESKDRGYGFFNVRVAGKDVGSGYCTGVNCHIQFSKSAKGSVGDEQTFVFSGQDLGSLVRMRSYVQNGVKWACEDQLKLQVAKDEPGSGK